MDFKRSKNLLNSVKSPILSLLADEPVVSHQKLRKSWVAKALMIPYICKNCEFSKHHCLEIMVNRVLIFRESSLCNALSMSVLYYRLTLENDTFVVIMQKM